MADNVLADAFRSILQSRQGQVNPIQGIATGTMEGIIPKPPIPLLQQTTPAGVPPTVSQNSVDPGKTQAKATMLDFLVQLGIPLLTAGIGSAVPGALPGAAGFSTGYAESLAKQQEIKQLKATKDAEEETKKWNDAYDTAISLSKTGPLGGITPTTPQGLDTLAQEVFDIKYGKAKGTEQITKEVREKSGVDKPSKYKEGESRTIDGVEYIRNTKGQWQPRP